MNRGEEVAVARHLANWPLLVSPTTSPSTSMAHVIPAAGSSDCADRWRKSPSRANETQSQGRLRVHPRGSPACVRISDGSRLGVTCYDESNGVLHRFRQNLSRAAHVHHHWPMTRTLKMMNGTQIGPVSLHRPTKGGSNDAANQCTDEGKAMLHAS